MKTDYQATKDLLHQLGVEFKEANLNEVIIIKFGGSKMRFNLITHQLISHNLRRY